MKAAFAAIDNARNELVKCRRTIRQGTSKQVRAAEDVSFVRATSYAWFNNHRGDLLLYADASVLQAVDSAYSNLLEATDKATVRTKYIDLLGTTLQSLSNLRMAVVDAAPSSQGPHGTSDSPPDLSSLIPDPTTQDAIRRRWIECTRCIGAGAPMAALVMMGGLLEGLLLARINRERIKSAIFTANSAPVDPVSGDPRRLRDWTLRNYIDVSHEIGWISQSAKDVGEVLRDYRNYIHPYKEISHGVALTTDDARVLWEVTKSLSLQVVKNI